MNKLLCLDTYALVEISKANSSYENILDENFVIPNPVIAEFYNILLREYNERTANYWLKLLKPYRGKIRLDVWIKAIKFKNKHKKEKLSFFDCIGYIFALENNMTFVTGDKQFSNKSQVLYIK
jgi:predicted nucleic acid-binding protein